MSTVWSRARARGGRGLDCWLFERAATRCEEVDLDDCRARIQTGDGKAWAPFPPEGNDWHLVCWTQDDEGRPAVLWRRLKVSHEIVP
jgi:hypothetical protein